MRTVQEIEQRCIDSGISSMIGTLREYAQAKMLEATDDEVREWNIARNKVQRHQETYFAEISDYHFEQHINNEENKTGIL